MLVISCGLIPFIFVIVMLVFTVVIFFFQAEDGIRYYKVTGVQTCALPISLFIGDQLAKDVFGEKTDPVGKTLLLQGSPFLVVGVLKSKTQDSSYSGRDKDKTFMAGTTLQELTGLKRINNFIFKAREVGDVERLKAQVLAILARKHHFDPKDKEALGIWDTTENFQFIDTFMLGFRIFLGVV